MLTAHFYGSFSVCQDPHLNRFFQQCQKRELDLSLPPTSNFLNCLKVRENTQLVFIYCDWDKSQNLDCWTCLINAAIFACQTAFCSLLSSILFISTLLHLLLLLRIFSTLLQGLLSMERIPVIIRFLPVLFNQLFKVLTQNDNDEVTTATTR